MIGEKARGCGFLREGCDEGGTGYAEGFDVNGGEVRDSGRVVAGEGDCGIHKISKHPSGITSN